MTIVRDFVARTQAGRDLLDRLSNLPNEGYPETYLNLQMSVLEIETEARQQGINLMYDAARRTMDEAAS